MDRVTDLLDELSEIAEGGSINRTIIPAKPARYAEPERPLSPAVIERLTRNGIRRLYVHQVRCLDMVRSGRDVMVTTGTASGKTLCYNLPVLETLLADGKAKALYLFPTKALAQDQLRVLAELDFPAAATYDGDTAPDARARARRDAAVILTNPDMLHQGILPHHKKWANFLMNLAFVVVDEAHSLRGAFGSNVAFVLRRLRRLCRHYGGDPRFILASATLANPQEHASALTGLDIDVISGDGAPRGRKFFLLLNPPLIGGEDGKRKSAIAEASLLLAGLARRNHRTICFSKTRRGAELVLKYAKDFLAKESDIAASLASYRAGYLPGERRSIERALFSGELRGVSATNALELGVDVGSLDATIINGFPGTITSVWQQAGRAGRRETDSVAVLIAGEDALDQYYVKHPEYFFGRSFEEAVVDLDNPHICGRHASCAAYELPLEVEDLEELGPVVAQEVDGMVREGRLKRSGKRVFFAGDGFPAGECSIRGASGAEFAIVKTNGELLATADAERAFVEIYAGAVYLQQGETYVVRELNIGTRVATAEKASVEYYTQAKEETNLWIDQELCSQKAGQTPTFFGQVSVESQVLGFVKKKVAGGDEMGYEELDLPPVRFSTEAFWFSPPPAAAVGLPAHRFAGGLHAIEHAAIALLPVYAMCDRWDVGGVSTPVHPELGTPAIFVYDGYAGGLGLSRRGFDVIGELLEAVLSHLRSCPCRSGCPSCVQSPKCGNLNEPLDKEAAIIILASILSGE